MNRCAPFACFRLPGEGHAVHEIGLQHEARTVATTAEELRERKHLTGFLMTPFAVTAETPMLWIEEEQGKQGARVLQLATCDEAQLESGLWLCASPEMLLRGDGADWQTVALAGTMPRQADGEPSVWSEKNRREHHYVQRFIGELLEQEGIPYRALDVETTTTGQLQHLQARFALQLPEGYAPITLAERLHPTPAVCGTPQRVAQHLILEEESAERSYYAGFLGWYEPERRVDLFVQIRCLQLLSKQALRLYAGGGIVRGSSLESEWQEVLHKLSAIHSLIR